jgi:Ca-activated chloride channel family protein
MGLYDRYAATLPEETRPARELLVDLAEQSGGRHFAVASLVELPEIAGRIGLELHNQYILGFRPNVPRRDGKYHRVQVKMAEGRRLTVSSRPGYYGR